MGVVSRARSGNNFSKLIQGEKQFQVPLYQRTYSWERDELQQLWDDVLDLVEEHLEGRTPAAHFLGSVVLAPGRISAGGIQRWLVVDGQQRLTTLMLAFAALRDRHRERGAERKAERIHDLVLVNKYRSGDDHYRLLSRRSSAPTPSRSASTWRPGRMCTAPTGC
ncbi:hypothetical protein DN402_24520 [Streptomyces sp. SW4]|nr:hypothetical protein DN402_24520 [Streptomyces sp. SW4]